MARRSLTDILGGIYLFGDYQVIVEGKYSSKNRYALCECKCGVRKDVNVAQLISGRSTCCKDCAAKSEKRVTNKKHGLSKSSEYGIYKGVIARCCNPKDMHYQYYGAKGISVCDRWKDSFENFYADMGPRPSAKHSIDRVDNSKGYSPDNCRWANGVEQQANRACTLKTVYNGEEVAISLLAAKHGILPETLAQRIKQGWSIEKALSTKVANKKPLHNVNGRMLTASQIESEYGTKRCVFNYRIRKGLSVLQAIGLE